MLGSFVENRSSPLHYRRQIWERMLTMCMVASGKCQSTSKRMLHWSRLVLLLALPDVLISPFASAQGPSSQAPQGKTQPRTARSTSAPLSNSEFESVKKQAEAAKDSNKVPEALRLYQRILGQKPEWAEGWLSGNTPI